MIRPEEERRRQPRREYWIWTETMREAYRETGKTPARWDYPERFERTEESRRTI